MSVYSSKATINLSHYLIGTVYYPAVMLVILCEAPKFAQNGNILVSYPKQVTNRDFIILLLVT